MRAGIHMVLGLLVLFLPDDLSAQNYQIGNLSTSITDTSRSNRSIGIEVFYPANTIGSGVPVAGQQGEQFPVIVIGHGFSMTYDAYANFWQLLVPLGYIVALPKTEVGPIPFPSHADFGADMSFTANWLLAEDLDSTGLFYNKISHKVAVLGHSMGGGCSFLAAEMNNNIDALAVFAPAETNPSAITAAANVTVPALVFAGSLDQVAPASGNQTPMYNALASTCKDYVTITDASHCGFANNNTLCNIGETTVCIGCSFIPRADQHAIQFSILVPWLNFYLKGECGELTIYRDEVNNPVGYSIIQNCPFDLPIANIQVTGNSSVCVLDTAYLTASGQGGYLWNSNQTDTTIIVTQPGTYGLTVTGYNNCIDSTNITLTVNNAVKPVIQSSAGNILCPGDSTELSVAGTYSGYQWSTMDSSQSITAQSGNFAVTITDGNGCTASSDTVVVNSATLYLNPTLVVQQDTMRVTEGQVEQWLYNGSPISNYTGEYLSILTPGDYQVVVSDTNGCLQTSPIYTVLADTANAITELNGLQVSMTPNPVNGLIQITVEKNTVLKLYDLYGNLILSHSLMPGKQMLDMSILSSQVYIAEIISGDQHTIMKLIKID